MGKKTGTIDNCLIRPMNDLMLILDKYKIKAIIFVDAAFLLRLEELMPEHRGLQDDYNKIKNHILAMHNSGHDIQLHFHPQWLYSTWKNGRWVMDTDHYKLSDMSNELAFNKFQKARMLLEGIVNKKITAFRAGGYSLATLDSYIELFKENDIKIDSSVLSGAYIKSKYHSYDYRNIPKKNRYNFSSDVTIEDSLGEYVELPITTKSYNSLLYLLLRQYYKTRCRHLFVYGDGEYIGRPGGFYNKYIIRIKELFKIKMVPASIDGFLVFFLPYIYKNIRDIKQQDLVIISHPKSLLDISLRKLDEFLIANMPDLKFLTTNDMGSACI